MQHASFSMVMLHINVALSHLHVLKKKVIGLWTVYTPHTRPLWACGVLHNVMVVSLLLGFCSSLQMPSSMGQAIP